MFFISILLYVVSLVFCHELLDPFDIIIDSGGKTVRETARRDVAISFYKRTINMLLNTVVTNPDRTAYTGRLNLNILKEDYDFLKNFAKFDDDETSMKMQKVDKILSQIYVKSGYDYISEGFIQFCTLEVAVVLSAIFVFFVSYNLVKSNIRVWTIAKYMFFLIWIIDFLFTWKYLWEKAKIDKMSDMKKYSNVPVECNPSQMSTFQFILSTFRTKDECKEYYNVLLEDAFWKISPGYVLSYQAGNLIKAPAVNIGNAIGGITSTIIGHLPWGLNIIVLPIALLFLLFIFCITLSFVTDTSFEINLFKLFHFKFGNKNKNPEVEKLRVEFDVNHRNFIQDIPAGGNELKSINQTKHQKRKALKDVKETESSEDVKESVKETTPEKEKEFVACALKKRVLKNNQEINIENNNCDEEVDKISKK